MSPGQCQRVALARAVITSPKLVLADEPTAALDGKSGAEVMQLLKELVVMAGAAAVVVTHDPRILSYADRVCEIENGRLVRDDKPIVALASGITTPDLSSSTALTVS
jgi:putative ABC transport system ATP-binding protein